MKTLAFVLALAAVASASVPGAVPNGANGFNAAPASAEPREYSSDFGSDFSSDPVYFSETAQPYSNFVPAPANNNVGFFGGDIIGTVLNVVLMLFTFSLILEIARKVLDMPLLDGLVGEARSLSSDDMVFYANMAMNAVDKFENLNRQ